MSTTRIVTPRIPIAAALVAILTMGFSLMPVGAAGAGNANTIKVPARSGPAHAATVAHGVNLSGISGTRSASGYAAYVYADDGQFHANTIDEYGAKPTGLTSLGTVLTGGKAGFVALAQNDIAVTNNSSHGACLIHTDRGGLVESFSINLSTGLLTIVSSVPEGDGFFLIPGDVKLSPNGNDAYVDVFSENNDPNLLVSFPIGPGCALGTPVTFTATSQSYYGISIPNAHQLFAIDSTGGSLDIYKIASDGLTLSPQTATPSQLADPVGATSGTVGATTFTFSATEQEGVEAHTLNTTSGTLGAVPGSPQIQPVSGQNVLFTRGFELVTQTQVFGGSVGAYSISGGALKFLNNATLDSTSQGPLAQTSISHFLLVENYISGTISACQLATSGVGGCVLVATLTTNGSGRNPAGIGVITA